MDSVTQQREVGWVELHSGWYWHCACGQLFPLAFMERDGHDVGGCCYDPYEGYEEQPAPTLPDEVFGGEDEPF